MARIPADGPVRGTPTAASTNTVTLGATDTLQRSVSAFSVVTGAAGSQSPCASVGPQVVSRVGRKMPETWQGPGKSDRRGGGGGPTGQLVCCPATCIGGDRAGGPETTLRTTHEDKSVMTPW